MRKRLKAQAGIITIILIVLIVLVGVFIVWNVVNPLVKEKSENIETESFTTDLNVESASVSELGSSKVILRRGTGKLDGLRFVFYDEDGNSEIEDKYDVGKELETKTYFFNAFANLGKINKIEVYPIVNDKLGIFDESNVLSKFSPYLVLFSEKGNSVVEELSFNDKLGISFWVNGNTDKVLLEQNFKVEIQEKKIVFSYNQESFESFDELTNGLNHVAVSIEDISKIYINNEIPISNNTIFQSFQSSGDLKIYDTNNLMIFNKSLDGNAVSSLYNSQLS